MKLKPMTSQATPRARAIHLGTALLLSLATPRIQALDVPTPPSEADFPVQDPAKVALGMLLFYDKILSGNENISCATCHHALAFTSDGLSLPVGEGGRGLGIARNCGADADTIHERVPRNAPHFFNAGAFEFKEIFWDGRLEEDPSHPSGFRSPAGDDLPPGLDNVLAAQAMFPVTSATEMAGQVIAGVAENPVAAAAHAGNLAGPGGVWEQLALRIQAIEGYWPFFQAAYRELTDRSGITMVHIANAIGAYEDQMFRAIDSPVDRFLRGDRWALSQNQQRGLRLFYGRAGCSACHSGPFQTDHDYHAIGMPQIGPGKGDQGAAGDAFGDFGRERVTGDPADRYKFRTPSLRNVALTGPWGHDGAYDSLEAMVRHHLDAAGALEAYDTGEAVLPPATPAIESIDFVHHNSAANRATIAAAIDPLLATNSLSDGELGLLLELLHALTDPACMDLRKTVPVSVPSGLPLAD